MNVMDVPPLATSVVAKWLLGVCLVILTGYPAAHTLASTVAISAIFFPDASNPHVNQFKNTTPNTGLCFTFPNYCQARGLYSIGLGVQALTQTPILANHANIRDGAMIKVPADERTIQVTSERGRTADLKFKITAFSASNRTRDVRQIVGDSSISTTTANNRLWANKRWGDYAPAPCALGGSLGPTSIDADFFWLTPEASPCGISPAFEIDTLRMRNSSISYQLIAPDPLRMDTGTYTGSMTYTVGPGGDFDYGNNLLATDNSVTINFTLEVQHTLKIELSPLADKVTLSPPGGWQQWLSQGVRPARLEADRIFNISASTPFSMKLQCEYLASNQCAIQNTAGFTVPVETRVTLPQGLGYSSGESLNRVLLSTTPEVIYPSQYVEKRPAMLHFAVTGSHVESIMNDHPGTKFRGNITVVWDSEIP